MIKFLKAKGTLFFILGILGFICVAITVTVLATGHSAPDKLMAMYIGIFGLIPSLLLLIIDRVCVWKFGAVKVNKVEKYILGIFILLLILNWIRLQSQL
ncbi:hypothetical protein [Sphingobacterium detergens]|uniref:Uncharacterized protein n=1 Tax=Sphingobacterium detergens TaxID=1145106 RepID=A0A420AR40_SPHD1|nr:hypothetical protein [Sphingobacterium detergens]RKE46897.1 hypothetical protein DFQ12_4055 [Sphingobacterium detergens]